ncbi:hypothetical protein HPB51_029267 [Rhipicephalus microplus]|uniref:Uncharacterized protein n=1 Tax=Rhipicephalus microplus TaxID=6941 RepID=A0A9J6CV17_RHIMP|nr:hypothetical protein HPB51_029267 [Rhipicephalus microplus]
MRTAHRCLPHDHDNKKDAAETCFPLVCAYFSRSSPALQVRRSLDDDFGGSFLDGVLYDPPFYHQRFYIQPRQASEGHLCPACQKGTSVACTPSSSPLTSTLSLRPPKRSLFRRRTTVSSFTESTRRSRTNVAAT